MTALSRPNGRQVRHLNLAPAAQLASALSPLLLFGVLITLAVRFIPQAKMGLETYSSQSLSSTWQESNFAIQSYPPHQGEFVIFTPEVQAWGDHILRWSMQHNLPPMLVATVMQIESCGAPNAESSAGAMGLFQVMPFHFSLEENPYDPEVNANRGLTYLSQSYELAGRSIEKSLAGYNAGHSAIHLDPASWPEETRRYVEWGSGIWDDIQADVAAPSRTLEKWLSAGGSSLCLQARNSVAIP